MCKEVPGCDATNWKEGSKCWMRRSYGLRSVENIIFEPAFTGRVVLRFQSVLDIHFKEYVIILLVEV